MSHRRLKGGKTCRQKQQVAQDKQQFRFRPPPAGRIEDVGVLENPAGDDLGDADVGLLIEDVAKFPARLDRTELEVSIRGRHCLQNHDHERSAYSRSIGNTSLRTCGTASSREVVAASERSEFPWPSGPAEADLTAVRSRWSRSDVSLRLRISFAMLGPSCEYRYV